MIQKKKARVLSDEEIAFNKIAGIPKIVGPLKKLALSRETTVEINALSKKLKLPKDTKKKFSLRKLCQLAWDAYGSKYYRFKDLLDRGDVKTGLIKCVTCSVVKHWTKFQGGHFIPRVKLDAWLLPDNAHCQCYSCNLEKGGNIHYYTDFMIQRYGEERVAEMKKLLYRPKAEVTREYIAERREFFKSKLKEWKVI
jgi:hypothetical protein